MLSSCAARETSTWQSADTGALTLILRFSIALNLNWHFHILFLGAVYSAGAMGYQRLVLPGQNISPTLCRCSSAD